MSGTELQKKEERPVDIVRRELNLMQAQFEKALPAHVPPERFVRIAMTAVSTNPQLQMCDRTVLYGELMKCAQDGLLPDGRDAAIVIYGKQDPKPRYMPMVGGICKKARNSGEITQINAHVVYENDEYDSWTDEQGDHFKFRKARGDRGKPILTFAFAVTKDGGFYFEEVDEEQMAAIEACSRASTGPWKGPFRDEMKRKSAIRRLAKYRLPSSTDLDEIIRRDDDMYDVTPPTTRESSQAFLEAAKAEKDYLPGIKPPSTAAQFVARLKDVPGGPDLIRNQVIAYTQQGDVVSHDKLVKAAEEAGLPVASEEIPDDEKFPFEKDPQP